MNTKKRKKLIARRLLDWSDIKIAKKNRYKDKNHHTFKGWTERDGEAGDEDVKFAKAAQKFLKAHPFAFVVACQLDMGKRAWKAWRGPLLIANEIGKRNFRPSSIAEIHLSTLTSIIRKAKLGARNLPAGRAARNLKELSKIICDNYAEKAQRIWELAKNLEDLRKRLESLPGFGVKLVNMTLKLLLGLGMVPNIRKTSETLRKLNVAPDVHVKRVFYRSGLSPTMNSTDVLKSANEIFPKMPAVLDSAFFIGREYCFKTDPNCIECPLKATTSSKKLCMHRYSE